MYAFPPLLSGLIKRITLQLRMNEWSPLHTSQFLIKEPLCSVVGRSRCAHVRLQKFIRLQWRQSTTKRRQKLTPGGHHSMAKCTSLPGKNKEEQRRKNSARAIFLQLSFLCCACVKFDSLVTQWVYFGKFVLFRRKFNCWLIILIMLLILIEGAKKCTCARF